MLKFLCSLKIYDEMEWQKTYQKFISYRNLFMLVGGLCLSLSALSAFSLAFTLTILSFLIGMPFFVIAAYYDRIAKGILLVAGKEELKKDYTKFVTIIHEQKPKQEIRPRFDLKTAIKIMENHLKTFYAHPTFIGSSRFISDRGVWEIIVETDAGNYLVEINNEGRVIRSDKLTSGELQKRLKFAYKIEDSEVGEKHD
jgi:hypothetical protein